MKLFEKGENKIKKIQSEPPLSSKKQQLDGNFRHQDLTKKIDYCVVEEGRSEIGVGSKSNK